MAKVKFAMKQELTDTPFCLSGSHCLDDYIGNISFKIWYSGTPCIIELQWHDEDNEVPG